MALSQFVVPSGALIDGGLTVTGTTTSEIAYSNVTSGLTASTVQAAIDEVSATVDASGSGPALFIQPTIPSVWSLGDAWIRTF